MKKALETLVLATVLVLTPLLISAAPSYNFFGDAGIVMPGNASPRGARIHSNSYLVNPTNFYGGVDYTVPSGLTIGTLTSLSTDFKATEGGCGGGGPRFVAETATGSVNFYVGTPPNYTCAPDSVWYSSGNLAAPANLVDATGYGMGFYEPWAAVQAVHGSDAVTAIYIVTDGGWAVSGDVQTLHLDNTAIQADVYTYEVVATNAAQCKNGGWQGVIRANGTLFKNQGDCVSYTQNGK